MPDPTQPQRLASPGEFAAAIRKQYPGPYDSIPDDQLTHAVVKQYPEYASHVVDVLGGGGDQARPTALPGSGGAPAPPPAPPPNPNSFMSIGDNVQAMVGEVGHQIVQTSSIIGGAPKVHTTENTPPVLMSPLTGTERVVKGVQGVAALRGFKPGQAPPDLQTQSAPFADIVGGAMEAGELGLIPAALAAPWATAIAVGVGTGVSAGITKIGQALGAPPALTELASDVGGLAAGGLAGHAVGASAAAGEAARVGGINETVTGAEGIRADVAAQDASRANLDADAHTAAQTFEEAKAAAFESLNINRALIAAADAARQRGAGAKSPFDYLDMAREEVRTSTADLDARRQMITDPGRMLPPAPPEVLSETRRGPGQVPADQLGAEPPPAPPEAAAAEPTPAAPPPPPFDVPQGLPRGGPDDFFQSLDTESAIQQAEADRVARQRLEAQPNPGARLLSGRKFEANAYSAEPRPMDEVGPSRVPKPELGPPEVPTSDPMVDRLASEFESSLTPPTEDPAVIEARQRSEILRSIPEDMASMVEDNPHVPGGLIDSGTVEGSGYEGRSYQNATPASKVFQDITKGAKTTPPVSLISDILRVYADTGAKSAKEIPAARLLSLRTQKGYGPREFLNAYDRWMPEVIRVRDSMASSKFNQQRMMEAARSGAFGDRPGMGQLRSAPPPTPGMIGFDEGAPPMPPPDDMPDFLRNLAADPTALGGFDEETVPVSGGYNSLADQLDRIDARAERLTLRGKMSEEQLAHIQDVTDSVERRIAGRTHVSAQEAEALGNELRAAMEGRGSPEQPSLPGAEGVRTTENQTPEFEAPFSLTPETGGGAAGAAGTGVQPSFWEALKSDAKRIVTDTEGELRFSVDPNDETAVRKWLRSKLAEYGDQPWHEAATQAIEEGDLTSAVRIIDIANGQSIMADRAAAAQKKDQSPAAAKAMAAVEDAVERTKQAHKAQIEAQLGIPLPSTVDVSPEGILTFQPGGKGVPAIRARATDLTMANALGKLTLDAVDPSAMIRLGTSGEVEPQFQISKQIGDYVAREASDEFISDMADLMGLDHLSDAEQRLEVARQFPRAGSMAGRFLGQIGRWVQQNEDLMYQVGPVNETGKIGELGSVGALQGSGIVDPDGFVRWLGGHATPEQLAEMKFELPRGYELKNDKGELTPAAKTYAKNWFSRLQRIHETQTTIDRLVGEQGNALDRAVMATTIAPQMNNTTPGRFAQINGLSKAFLISRPGTMIRNAISQSGRYASGMADEAVASLFSLATGNTDQATLHARNMRYLAQGLTRSGTSSLNLFKHPWAEGLQATYDYTSELIRTLPPDDARKSISLLTEVPHEEGRFLGALSLEGMRAPEGLARSKYKAISMLQAGLDAATQPGVRNTMTILNRVQEHFFRASVFDAMLRSQIEAKGLDPMEMLAGDPRGLIDKVGAEEFDRMAGAAVSTALDYTFAADPLPGTAPAILLNAFQHTPVLSFFGQLGMPFPRFNFVSAPRWVWDHTPFAPLTDSLLLGISATMRNDASPLFRGRLHQMLQMKAQESTLLDLDAQLGRAKFDSANFLSDFLGAKEGSRQAGKVLKGLEGRKATGSELEALQPDLERIRGEQESQQAAAVMARAKWREQEIRVKNLTAQREKAKGTYNNLTAVGAAKSPQEYFARAATGTAMMGAGWALWKLRADHSTTPGSPDTQWYEIPADALPVPKEWLRKAGVDGQNIDLRSFSPEIQHFFLPDVLADVEHHTDWSKLDMKQVADPHYMTQFLSANYTGKYTGKAFMQDAMEAYLTMSPASGSTRELLDIISGRSASGNGGLDPGAVSDVLLSMAGQFVGRFTAPLTPISDVVGQFDPEEAKARIPAEGTPETHSTFHSLVDPALANIPFARRAIPEKIDALTGQPVATVDPVARQFGGITKRLQNRLQEEMNATGVSYGQLVPRQTGDREFDNAVNTRFAAFANEVLPEILDDETYKQATPELKRDILVNGMPGQSGVFAAIKQAAVQGAIEDLQKDPALLKSPNAQAKLARWQAFAEKLDQELQPALAADQHRQELEDRDRADQANQPAPYQVTEPEPGGPPGVPQF